MRQTPGVFYRALIRVYPAHPETCLREWQGQLRAVAASYVQDPQPGRFATRENILDRPPHKAQAFCVAP